MITGSIRSLTIPGAAEPPRTQLAADVAREAVSSANGATPPYFDSGSPGPASPARRPWQPWPPYSPPVPAPVAPPSDGSLVVSAGPVPAPVPSGIGVVAGLEVQPIPVARGGSGATVLAPPVLPRPGLPGEPEGPSTPIGGDQLVAAPVVRGGSDTSVTAGPIERLPVVAPFAPNAPYLPPPDRRR